MFCVCCLCLYIDLSGCQHLMCHLAEYCATHNLHGTSLDNETHNNTGHVINSVAKAFGVEVCIAKRNIVSSFCVKSVELNLMASKQLRSKQAGVTCK